MVPMRPAVQNGTEDDHGPDEPELLEMERPVVPMMPMVHPIEEDGLSQISAPTGFSMLEMSSMASMINELCNEMQL